MTTPKLAEGAVGRAIHRCKDRLNSVRQIEGSSVGIGLNLSSKLRGASILKSLYKTSGMDGGRKNIQQQKNYPGVRMHHFPDDDGWDEEQAAVYSISICREGRLEALVSRKKISELKSSGPYISCDANRQAPPRGFTACFPILRGRLRSSGATPVRNERVPQALSQPLRLLQLQVPPPSGLGYDAPAGSGTGAGNGTFGAFVDAYRYGATATQDIQVSDVDILSGAFPGLSFVFPAFGCIGAAENQGLHRNGAAPSQPSLATSRPFSAANSSDHSSDHSRGRALVSRGPVYMHR